MSRITATCSGNMSVEWEIREKGIWVIREGDILFILKMEVLEYIIESEFK